MRSYSLVLMCMFGGIAGAQDVAQQAMQMQQQQILQQQVAQQQIDLVNQQQLNQAGVAGLGGYRIGAQAPRLQQQPGTAPGTVVIRMEDRSRGASIFYTTDGWTPTAASNRYVGPITVHQGVTVQAIAIAAGGVRSYVTVAPISPGASVVVPAPPEALHVQALEPGTRLPLVFEKTVTSKGVQVGDSLPVGLAGDIFVNGKLAAAKGTWVEAIVTQVDNSHAQGLPGVLSFSVQLFHLEDGSTVPLLGVETMEGADRTKKANVFSIIPLGGLAVHGGDAFIATGARLQAQVKGSPNESAHLGSN